MLYLFYDNLFFNNKIIVGPSIIKKAYVYKIHYSSNGRGSTSKIPFVSFKIGNKTFERIMDNGDHYKENTYHYIYWNIECAKEKTLGFYNIPNLPYDFKLTDPSFTENGKFYTYHDYSLLKPDLVYYNVGFNIMYKSTKHIVNDSVINLHFAELDGTLRKVSYKPNYDISEIDTFLVFKNINEKFEDTWHVCAPDINTPENWAKISDYGYIFHYDIYSRYEIEDSCQQIRNYVLKYKESLENHK
ncbi:MAG: hypothetical protein MJ211_10825 [Bacteroidales bacterium]|nr:hypothetical protein [Bacteroidales bacterium]